jgi:hypothetical protein
MSSPVPPQIAPQRRDPFAVAALLVALLALVFSLQGAAPAKRKAAQRNQSTAKLANKLKTQCPISNAIKFGSWCLEAAPHRIPPDDVGLNDYFYATQTCAREGGWLPSAAQLIGAARKASLQSTIDDSPATSGAEEFPDPTRGIKDKREMSGDLFTTTAGAAAAGSEGVTVGSKGNQAQGEPDPVPMPASPSPETLQYVTVYDNHNLGGFAGGAPVTKPENFRCAYAIGSQGKPKLSAGN